MTILFSGGAEHSPATTVPSALEVDAREAVVKADVSLVMMNGRHYQHAIKLLWEEGGFKWIAEQFCMHLFMQSGEATVKPAEAESWGRCPTLKPRLSARSLPLRS